MDLLRLNGAKLVKLLILLLFLSSCNLKIFNKNKDAKDGKDTIQSADQMKERREVYGMKIKSDEREEFAKIQKKTAISKKEKKAREKARSGMKLTLMDKYRLARANRKDYLYKKRVAKYTRKIIERRQSKEMKEKMIQDRKRVKKRDRAARRKTKWKAFKNLFR